jgi:lia operon protein LiaF
MRNRILFGLILIIAGALLMLHNLDIEVFSYGWPAAIILVGVYIIFRSSRKPSSSGHGFNEFKAFGDVKHSNYTGNIDGSEISHFIGDVDLNLISAQFNSGTNHLSISSFIGDIKIVLPQDIPVEANCSSFLGDFHILGRKEDGIFHSVREKTPGYDTAEKKLQISCTSFIGDIKINNE